MAKNKRIYDEMTARQILLNVNKILNPYEICIRSYRGKAYNLIHVYEVNIYISKTV